MSQPKVSIVMSTYNRAGLLAEAIQSVMAQAFTDFELIVVDDGSQDHTREVVAGFADPRICYVYQDNAGLSAGRNTGIAQAIGEYVSFLDDDDLYLQNRLTAQINFMDENPHIGWTSGGCKVTDIEGNALAETRPWLKFPELDVCSWLLVCPTTPSAVTVRREWLQRIGGFDPLQRLYEDWELWLRLAHVGCPMAWVPEIVCVYRVHTANMTRNSEVNRVGVGVFRMLDKFFALPDLAACEREQRAPAYARMWLRDASAKFQVNAIDAALQDVQRALELDPTLAAEHGRLMLDILVDQAYGPQCDDPLTEVGTVLKYLTRRAVDVGPRERKLLGEAADATFFRAARRRNWPLVRRAFFGLIRYDPARLRNRGVWSLLGSALIGPAAMKGLRALYHPTKQPGEAASRPASGPVSR